LKFFRCIHCCLNYRGDYTIEFKALCRQQSVIGNESLSHIQWKILFSKNRRKKTLLLAQTVTEGKHPFNNIFQIVAISSLKKKIKGSLLSMKGIRKCWKIAQILLYIEPSVFSLITKRSSGDWEAGVQTITEDYQMI